MAGGLGSRLGRSVAAVEPSGSERDTMLLAADLNGANGMSDIEGKAAREAVSKCGQRASFNGARSPRRSSGLGSARDPRAAECILAFAELCWFHSRL